MVYYNWLQNSAYWQEQFNPKPKQEVEVAPAKVTNVKTKPTKPKTTRKPRAKAKPKK